MKHIIDSQAFDRNFLDTLFEQATLLEGVRDGSLKGKIMASLFYEPSTRTRFSFESAFLRLGGSVISTENAKDFSSAAKGETVEDTMRMLNGYVDVAVIRHFEEGSLARAASVATIPVINAGDGAGQHPTQSLLDLYTILKELGNIDGIRIALVGDLKHGRTVRSLCYLLGKYTGVEIVFVSPSALVMKNDIKEYLTKHNVPFSETDSLEEGIKNADVVYMTRIQKERFSEPKEYESLKGRYVLTKAHVDDMKEGSIVMHPLPRVDEIAVEVDSSPKAAYFRQAAYGVAVRMALLKHVLQ